MPPGAPDPVAPEAVARDAAAPEAVDDPEYMVTLADPGDVAAALPYLVGFPPAESMVLIGLGGNSGNRVGLTARVDIPPVGYAVQQARALAARLATDGPDAAVLAVVSEAPDVLAFPEVPACRDGADGGWADGWDGDCDGLAAVVDLPHRQLAWDVTAALAAHSIPVRHLLLVRDGRWWSYDCPETCCAPGAGTAVPGGVPELAAASVATGQVTAASREELERRIARSAEDDAAAMAETVVRLGRTAADLVRTEGDDVAADRYWDWITDAVAHCSVGAAIERLTDDDVARVAWGLRDGHVRDRALGLCVSPDADAAERLWIECTRRAPAPLDAAPATLLAVSVWLRGNGAMAGIALDRALDSDPDYALARLLSRGLDGCLPPRELRAMIVGTQADLARISAGPASATARPAPARRRRRR
jgi:hypothetical protein